MNSEFMIDFGKDSKPPESDGRNQEDDTLDNFTSSILSQYASGLNPPICKVSSSTQDAPFQPEKLPFDFSNSSNDDSNSVNSDDLSTFNNCINKIEILYTMSTKLEKQWNDWFHLIKERSNYNRYDLSLKKPSIWKQNHNLNDLHLESISRWIEISSNILCSLAYTLNIDSNLFDLNGSKLLQESIDEAYSKFNTDISKVWEQPNVTSQQLKNDFKNDYLKMIKFNTRLQSNYERILEKLRNERDEAISKAEQKTVLEKEICSLKNRISKLEQELVNKDKEIEDLNKSLESSNRIHLQVIKKNEELVSTNQKLMMDKSNFIDKDTAKQIIKQYYDEESRGGERKEDIVQLLERMLDINMKSKKSEASQHENRRSLLNEFMEFVNENVESR
ncbi:hypothetical protein TpMuguga_01g02605 [Theileria parva strain Muguga]|uniref:uncharacterized protein n=1 Tax=Theileria parva strain Muguga TaxID=333668 RepID=UPI001C61B3A5|nr:uncharacterized protein TpMuguga_01g02605 [Theileria parva strain Muguga]KAF5153335.1 hypothetical protein TpMuguga_01g02605 [Theileria parva strain Muguga]